MCKVCKTCESKETDTVMQHVNKLQFTERSIGKAGKSNLPENSGLYNFVISVCFNIDLSNSQELKVSE